MSLSALVVVLILIAAALWFGQRSLIYFPSSDVPSPADAGLASAEPVTLRTEDGLELGAWFVPPGAPPSGYTVIVFNGNAGHRGYRAGLARGLAGLGAAVLLLDYRGYGGNPGLPHEQGLRKDARAALVYLRSRRDVDPLRLVYFGESLGTGVAVELALEYAPAALVLRSPFASLESVAREHFPFVPARWLLRDRYDSIGAIDRVRSPLLIIAGDRDTIVPFADSQDLYERAHEPKRFVTIAGADHNDEALAEGPEVVQAIREWLEAR